MRYRISLVCCRGSSNGSVTPQERCDERILRDTLDHCLIPQEQQSF